MNQGIQYILHKKIARGGMAEIYLGKALGVEGFEKICAIKRILPHYSQEKEFIDMFRLEASVGRMLQHANIVQIYDFNIVQNSYALVMEFVNGSDLRSLLAHCEGVNNRLSVPMTIHIAAQVARGLHYAHTRIDDVTGQSLQIIHRDISPQNILVSFDGEVKLIDFGIAKFEEKSQDTKPGVVKGKYSYMSPEQIQAAPLDGRSDVFSLAIVLWEMLAMKRLFAARSEVETIRNVQNCHIQRSLLDLNANVDSELNQIILKALHKDRAKRYVSAQHFEQAMQKYLNIKYPEFTSATLGIFIKQAFHDRKDEMQKSLKELSQVKPEDQDQIAKKQGKYGENIVVWEEGLEDSSADLDLRATNVAVAGGTLRARPVHVGGMLNNSRRSVQISKYDSIMKAAKVSKMFDGPDSSDIVSKRPTFPFMKVIMSAIVLGLSFYIGLQAFEKYSAVKLGLESTPQRLQVEIDGEYLSQDGSLSPVPGYITTPIQFSLFPGLYNLTLSHQLHHSKSFELRVPAGKNVQLPKQRLKPLPTSQLYRVNIGTRIGTVNIDDGYYYGEGGKQVTLSAGRVHKLTSPYGSCTLYVRIPRKPVYNLVTQFGTKGLICTLR